MGSPQTLPSATAINWLQVIQILQQYGPQAVALIQALIAALSGQSPPAPANQCAGRRYGRGLRPTPRHVLASATPYTPHPHHLASVPSKFMTLPSVMYMLGNDTYGDCVTAEEAASKMAFSIWGQVGVAPTITITDATAVQWARGQGALNGADLAPIMTAMQTQGMKATDGNIYTDGAHAAVDYTNDTLLRAAIAQGPVKIGLAADQLENAVNSTNGDSGWFLLNAQPDNNEDHCTSLWGYGTLADLVSEFQAGGVNISLPSNANPNDIGYGLYTWKTCGIVNQKTILNIVGEGWLRTPTTVQPTPAPTPGPTPSPTPGPTPGPTPTLYTGSVTVDAGAFGMGHVTFNFSNGALVSVN